MTTRTARPSREIDGKGRSVRELLAGRKYSIDYYQREYKWQKKQVADLLDTSPPSSWRATTKETIAAPWPTILTTSWARSSFATRTVRSSSSMMNF